MHRHATYSYSQPATTHRYSSTSSAFSASANPNEDWTKISDLAERRRIQNRIAQRNYRKKLKKRLEDLERRAASNSASPEQRPAELDRSATQAREEQQQPQPQPQQQRQEASAVEPVEQQDHRRSAESYSYPYPSHPEDRGLFSHQYTRQLSTSPPPFSYSSYPTPDSTTYAPYASHTSYYSLPTTTTTPELPVFSPYLPPLSSAYSNTLPSMVHPVKQEYYEEEISPFSMSYASMAGIDIPAPHSYQDSNPQTPPLSDSFDASAAGSPPESTVYPTTPASMPGTPPLHLLH